MSDAINFTLKEFSHSGVNLSESKHPVSYIIKKIHKEPCQGAVCMTWNIQINL